MVQIVLIMLAGLFCGWAIRNRRNWLPAVDRLILISIYLLLALLGFSIGSDKLIVSQLGSLGAQAFILSISGISGSVILAWIAWKYWFNKPKQS